MSITTKQETITPKWAEEVLSKHYDRIEKGEYRQRPVYKSVLRKYMADMRSGSWKLTATPIVFDEDGNLANGQHRLESVKQTGVTIEAMISRGWPPGVIDTEDRGKNRTVADQLHLHGVKAAGVIAASVAGIVRVCYRGNAPAISYASCRYILDDLGMHKHIQPIYEIFARKGAMSGRTIGPLAFYRTVNVKKADRFAEELQELTMTQGSGSHLYAKYLRDRNPNSQEIAVRAICTCLRYWDEDETAEFIKPNYTSVDWLADRNKKLSKAIIDMLGLISTGKKRVEA